MTPSAPSKPELPKWFHRVDDANAEIDRLNDVVEKLAKEIIRLRKQIREGK